MKVTFEFQVKDDFQFPEFAGRGNCDLVCPMFLWDGEGHDYCAAAQSRTDGGPVKCPFHQTRQKSF